MSNQSLELDPVIPSQDTSEPTALNATSPASQPAKPHCRHRVRGGRYCRLPVLDPSTGLCFRHSSLRLQEVESADLSKELLHDLPHFSSAQDLREFLTRLLILMTEGRVSPRRAAVLAYITNQLLHTHSVVEKEEKELEKNQPVIFDLPRPNRD